jgi:hypothetical protein
MFSVAQIQLVPRDAVRISALGATAEVTEKADADVVDREAFEERVAADEVVRHEELAAVAVGEHFLDAPDTFAVDVDDSAAEEQLHLYLIRGHGRHAKTAAS